MNVKGIMDGNGGGSTKWAVKEDHDGDDICDSISIGSMSEDSINSSSSSSSELADEEATSSLSIASSSSSSSSFHSNGPLYQLSELMDHLPIKGGLSMFYKGKAQSFTSLARVQSIEDLPKKLGITPYRKKIKTCKSYGASLDGHRISYSYTGTPKATISKKAASSRGSFVSVLSKSRPSIAVHTRSNF